MVTIDATSHLRLFERYCGAPHTGHMEVSERYTDCPRHELMHAIGFDNHWHGAAGAMPSVLAPR